MLRKPAETPPHNPPGPARALVRPCARAQVPQTAAEVPAGAPVDLEIFSPEKKKNENQMPDSPPRFSEGNEFSRPMRAFQPRSEFSP